MANFIDGGNLAFKSLMYGESNPRTLQYLNEQMHRATQTLTSSGQQFMDWGRSLFEHLESSETTRAIRAAGRALRSLWDTDEIRPFREIGQFQFAQSKMQRWIMAEPTVRSYFDQQRVDGYSDQYVDLFPKVSGADHYDWRRVMDGVVTLDKEPNEDGEYGWTAVNYLEELLEDDVELSFDEQIDVQQTWEHLRSFLEAGKEDPTSRFNADMG